MSREKHCPVCPRHCRIEEGVQSLCKARFGGRCDNYGKISSVALDPIEKKPLARFYPGSNILSVGSYGCNLRCPFCQNHTISMHGDGEVPWEYVSPESLINKALELKPYGNIGIAFTYNEPLIGLEYVLDCAQLAKNVGLKTVVVTNGCFDLNTLETILPYIDAFNVDLKAYNETFYKKIGGDLETVKRFIARACEEAHVEVTTLIIPGENDDEDEIRQLAKFLSSINPNIVLHLTRFFPQYQWTDKEPTPIESLERLKEVANTYLNHVVLGNV